MVSMATPVRVQRARALQVFEKYKNTYINASLASLAKFGIHTAGKFG